MKLMTININKLFSSIQVCAIVIIICFATSSVYAEYYIVSSKPYIDCPCYCEKYYPIHHHKIYRHHHKLHHYRYHCAPKHHMYHKAVIYHPHYYYHYRYYYPKYPTRHVNSYTIEEKTYLDLDRRTADDVSSDLQID